MTTAWDTLHAEPRHQLRYPAEHVVRWLASLPTHEGEALDIGCGSGRHLNLMADYGYAATGIDTTDTGFIRGDMCDLPFDDSSFDIALAYAVFYYATLTDADKAIAEMHRVLKPGGHALAVVRSTADWRNKQTRGGQLQSPGHPEHGLRMHFLAEYQIRKTYGAFKLVEYELTETTTNQRTRKNSDWLITLTK